MLQGACFILPRAAALLLLAQWFGHPFALCQEAPCIDPAVTHASLADHLNPRSSGDGSVLLNLPISRLFCSPTVARYLIIGGWQERNQLSLNESQPYSASKPMDVASHSTWRAIDVSEASLRAAFDFLVEESQGLMKDAEYFVAVRGCSALLCSTAGVAKFTIWNRPAEGDRHIGIIVGCTVPFVILAIIASIVFIWYCRCRSAPSDRRTDYESDTYLCADRARQHSAGAMAASNSRRPNLYRDSVDPETRTSDQPSEVDSGQGDHASRVSEIYEDIDSSAAAAQPPPAELLAEDAYDEITVNMDETDQQPGVDARGVAETSFVGAEPQMPHAAANMVYGNGAYVSADRADNSWTKGTNNRVYDANLTGELYLSKNDIDRHGSGIVNGSYGIPRNPGLLTTFHSPEARK